MKMTQKAIDSEAQAWFLLRQERSLSQPEQEEFERWHNEPTHQQSYQQLHDICNGLEILAQQQGSALKAEANAGFGLNKLLAQFFRGLSLGGTPTWATAMLCLVLLAGGANWLMPTPDSDRQLFTTTIGEQQQLTLADGSQVFLGADSQIQVQLKDHRRDISLIKGQAFFNVSKDVQRPFFVNSGSASIRVVGTRFDVRRVLDKVKISVEEGIVEVTHQQRKKLDKPSGQAVAAGRTQRLVKGQQVRLNAANMSAINVVPEANLGSWRNGQLAYNNAPLSELVADINRYRQGRISLSDNTLGDLRITSSFAITQLDTVVELLEQSLPVTVRKDGPKRLLILPRHTAKMELDLKK